MPYLALARKWRPRRFDQIVGQPHIVKILSHALTQNKIHHAYLFTGYHGIGKTTLARIFAKCLNCETGITATPCDQCNHCQEIDAGRFPDLLEIDAASRTKVEDTRELLDHIAYAPTKGRFKVYLIDEVHMLSGHSFNALLKTLEEPPSHVKFLLATTDPQKLPATVLSRCLQFHLSKMTVEETEKQLAFILTTEKITFESSALSLIAQAANGSMRDALSLLDQCIAYGNGAIRTLEIQALLGLSDQVEITALIEAVHQNNTEAVLSLTDSFSSRGIQFSRCLSELLTQLHQLGVMQSLDNPAGYAKNAALKNLSSMISQENVHRYYQIALRAQQDLLLAPTARIGFEMCIMRMMILKSSENVIKTPVLKEPAPAESKKNESRKAPVVAAENTWNSLLYALKLTGPTLALAQHCTMQSLTHDQLDLIIHPKYAALLHTRHQLRIQEALTIHLERTMAVNISINEKVTQTPADEMLRVQTLRTESAKQAISADPAIQRIVKKFDANVISDSIEPIKTS